MPQQFASDNNAGICPEALEALLRANAEGHVTGYGDDPWTERARVRLRELFETDAQVFFVFNGTAANALALAQLCKPYHAVIAHAFSHIEEDEAGAPALFSGGAKIVTADTPLAKLTPAAVDVLALKGQRGVHHVKARALSITQATELGTVYTPGEVGALCEVARSHGLAVHMDGARFANALATSARPRTSPGAPASTCYASAASRTAWRWARRYCSSLPSWRPSSSGASSRRAISIPRCGW
jgi:threonine aldolase